MAPTTSSRSGTRSRTACSGFVVGLALRVPGRPRLRSRGADPRVGTIRRAPGPSSSRPPSSTPGAAPGAGADGGAGRQPGGGGGPGRRGRSGRAPVALVRVETIRPERCPACRRGERPTNARVSLAPGGPQWLRPARASTWRRRRTPCPPRGAVQRRRRRAAPDPDGWPACSSGSARSPAMARPP